MLFIGGVWLSADEAVGAMEEVAARYHKWDEQLAEGARRSTWSSGRAD